MKKCKFEKPDGSSCRAYAMQNSDYCFWHDKGTADKVRAAGRKGGLQGMPKTLENVDFTIKDSADLFRILSEVMVNVLQGRLSPKIANSASYIGSQVLKSFELMNIEKRVDALEKSIEKKRG